MSESKQLRAERNQAERIDTAVIVLCNHRRRGGANIICQCGHIPWGPIHIATMLDHAGVLCALYEHPGEVKS